MSFATLGASGLRVSRAALGTMNFGTTGGVRGCDEPTAARIVGAFLDAGHNLIDTADAYAGGESERIVGRAVRGRRDQVVLATKAGMPQGPGPNDRGLSRAHLTRALEASLRRLGTDHVDLYQCHQWDPGTPVEETLATLDGFVRAGKVRYLGCSGVTAAQLVEAHWTARRLRAAPLVSVQPQLSLIARDALTELLPTAAGLGIGAIVWSPLGGGVLTGRYLGGTVAPGSRVARLRDMGTDAARGWAESMLRPRHDWQAGLAAAVAADLRATPTAVAVAWAGRQPGVTSVIIGPRTVEQLADNLAGFDLDLPAPAAARLDEDPADLVRRYFTMWRTGDASTVDTLLAPDWTDHGHPSVRCPADVAAAVTPIPVRLDTVLTDGATVTATGRVGDTELVWVFRTHEGRLRSLRTYR
ncbi:aldo/keto reductase [Dactylosporangium aurantiacum]|uniref:Aldo/keto reductase n=1 Tax=Dactylosporangium aurantiacum TaxID=35754 RepID=A0A9Q9IIX4_9ACTN|nr:aldo/keto reductase [Dactylosporangium aurantiacum]MDG6105722.1 aldo/keto reductase [Dactylosporangium aurantiacum]UWZ56957.1 aldo/keto reductase [Dactylosporangium aurantiacum]